MRYFIALELPQNSKEEIKVIQEEFKKIIPGARLTDNDKLHLTIAFVGEKPDKFQKDLEEMLKKATQNIPPFAITPAYIDGFPNLHEARIFWIGVKGDIDKLMIIRERIKDGLVQLGLDVDDRRYTPHIAIAKINNSFRMEEGQEERLQQLMAEKLNSITVSSLKLFESIPEEGFHTHNTLAEVPLQTT